jgi:PAS domain S-box-containing protein
LTSDFELVQLNSQITTARSGAPFPRLFSSQLSAFLAELKIGLIIENNQRRVLYLNPYLCRLMGVSARPEDLIGKSYTDFIDRSLFSLSERNAFLFRTEDLLRSRTQTQGDLLTFADGRTLEFDCHPVFLNEEYQGHLWVFRDVTERELARRANDRFLETLLEVLPDVVYIFDLLERKSVFVSPKIMTALGYSPSDLEAMGSELLPRLVHPEDQAMLEAYHANLPEAEDRTSEVECRIAHRDGTWRWFHFTEMIFRRDAQGRPEHLFGIAQDITKRKVLEIERAAAVAALKETERRLAQAQSVAHVGSWEYDVASGNITWSPETFRIFDIDPLDGEPKYDTIKERLSEEDLLRLEEGMQNAIHRGVAYSLDLRILKSDGRTTRWIHISGRPVADSESGDGVTRLVGVIQDIEERYQLEQQVRHTDKMQALGQFAAEVTHEINNPIAAISGVAQLLEHHPEPQVAEDGRTIRDMADRAGNIVRSLRKFVQEGSAFPASSPHPFIDLNHTVKTAINLVKRQRGLTAADTEIELADNLPLVAADAAQIEQIIINLISNARQAMASQPRSERHLRIQTSIYDEGQRRLLVRITDTGPGIPEELQDRIFAPFFTTKTRSKGMGLGLSICRSIARTHSGDIIVESMPGEGSTFTLWLPAPASLYERGNTI